jgi:ribonuclease HI
MEVKIYLKGSSIIKDEKMRTIVLLKTDKNEITRMFEFNKRGSPLEAEYLALIKIADGLKNLKNRLTSVKIFSTIEVMVRQIEGRFRVSSKEIIPLYLKLMKSLRDFNYSIHWISKEEMSKVLRFPVDEISEEKLRALLDRVDFDIEDLWV